MEQAIYTKGIFSLTQYNYFLSFFEKSLKNLILDVSDKEFKITGKCGHLQFCA